MVRGVWNRRSAPWRRALAWAAVAAASGCAAAGQAQTIRPAEEPSPFAAVPTLPLLEAVEARAAGQPPGRAADDDLGPFRGLAAATAAADSPAPVAADAASPAPVAADAAPPAASAAEAPPQAAVLATLAPDPVPAALFSALAKLVARDSGRNPLGAGDWRAARAAIGAFYAGRGFRPVFVDADGLTAGGRSVADRIARAGEDGLHVPRPATPGDLAGPLEPEALANAEVALAAAVVIYAAQASGSRLQPSGVSPLLAAEPKVAGAGEALEEIAEAADPGARLAEFNPPQRAYRALREALARLDAEADHAAGFDVGASVADASRLPGDPALAAAAGPRGRKAAVASAAPARRNEAARERADILANMEMWRWEPRDMGERRIEVNIPDFSVSVMDGDSVLMSSRVVVGKPDTPTPVFSETMRYVLINPSWQVPESIIRKEILPRLGHFARLGYEVKTVGGRVVVRQPPGAGNALGRFAFMFPNDHSVYLHDTPARALFSEDMRALSHGCVRVEDPERLAEIVLDWPETRVDKAVGGPERTVFLPRPLPVHIEYFTTFVDADGTLERRADIYGLTQRVASTLAAASQY